MTIPVARLKRVGGRALPPRGRRAPGADPDRIPGALSALIFATLTVAVLLLRPLLPIDETRYLTVAWEMRLGHDWLVPHLNGALYGHKPPLLFWLVNLVWSAVGVSELAARLVAPAFGVVAVALTAVTARALWPQAPGRAGRAALILATTGAFIAYGTATMFDTMLAAATLGAMLALWRLSRGGGTGWAIALGAALALGVLAKGPVILVHVAPAALLVPLWRDPALPFAPGTYARRLAVAVVVAIVLAGLWLVPALILGGPDYRDEVLWRQSAGRMVGAFAHARPAWWFALLLPLYLWPWGWTRTGLAALAPRALAADAGSRLVLVWAVGAFAAFSLISGKQAHYLVPELPALALLLSRTAPGHLGRWGWLPAAPAAVLVVLGTLAALGLIPAALREGLTVPWPNLAGAAGLVLLLGVVLWRMRSGLVATAAVAPLTLLALLVIGAPVLWSGQDAGPLARLLAGHEAQGIAIRAGSYQGQFGFVGHLTAPVALMRDEAAVLRWGAEHPGGVLVVRQPDPAPPWPAIGRDIFQGRLHTVFQVPEAAR